MKLNYKKLGTGPNLIILHGLLGSLDNWQTLAKKFAEDYTVYTLDQRNHGMSPHVAEMNYQAMSEDLKQFIADHQIDQPVLLGHSMGGKTVMTFALEYPELTRGLIVADMSPKAYSVQHQYILDALASVNFSVVKSRSEVTDILMKALNNMGVVQFLAKNVYWREKDQLDYRFNLSVLNESIKDISDWVATGQYLHPTLFIRGGLSNYVLDADENVKTQFPHAELQTIEGAGHWLHAEKPLEFYNLVLEFLKNLPPQN